MITNPQTSLNKLDSFFKNESSFTELDIPELIMMDTNTGYNFWNRLIINNPNLISLNLKNMQQSPYILVGENLLEVDLSSLQEVEFYDVLLNSTINSLPTRILQNTKIQTLDLPNFIGTARPIPQGSDDITNGYAQYASFWNNYWLTDVSLGNSLMNASANSNYKFNGFWFRNNYFLRYLRLNYPYVIPLVRTEGFNTTPIARGNGYIYVPDDLQLAYQNADNWNTLKSKIKKMSEYNSDVQSNNANFITKSWSEILTDCANGTLGTYEIGQRKMVKIYGIPTEFIIVGKNEDTLANDTTKKASLSWLGATISNFTTINVADTFDNSSPRQYGNAINFRAAVTNIYNGIEDTVKNGIKSVVKYSKGYNSNNTAADYPSIESGCWPPSAVELGIGGTGQDLSPYSYFDIARPWDRVNYHLGATTLNEGSNASKICVALRDYTSTSSYPDVLRALDNASTPMEIVKGNTTRPYLIVGFCT